MNVLIMYSNFRPTKEHLYNLKKLLSGYNIIVADSEDCAVNSAKGTKIILGHRYLRQTLNHTSSVEWIQSTAGGIDHIVSPGLLNNKKIVLTRAAIFSDIISIHAFTLALALIRRIPEAVKAQTRGQWLRPIEMLPMTKKAMVFGLGDNGKALARLLKKNGIKILGIARRTSKEKLGICDKIFVNEDWRKHLFDIDACFLILPLTKFTKNFFDKEAIESLPSHAFVINVGRASVIDQRALIDRLNSGKLAAAALDVLNEIPSPHDPIWNTSRLLITPHVAIFNPLFQKRLEKFVENQVRRYVYGKKLLYKVSHKDIIDSYFEDT